MMTPDRLGFYAYHLTEHHGTPLAITGSPHLMLAAAAGRTTRLRLGTLITILSLYHPMRLIEEAVTLDQLTGGRLDLGVGRGVSPAELAFHGVSGEAEAQERFDEAFEILRQGLTSDTVTFSGKHYTLALVPYLVLAPTNEEAMKIANRAFARFRDSLFYLWKRYEITPPPIFPADTFEGICATGHFYAGDPAGARDWVARHRDAGGISYMALETCFPPHFALAALGPRSNDAEGTALAAPMREMASFRTRCRCRCCGIRCPLPVAHPSQGCSAGNGYTFWAQRHRQRGAQQRPGGTCETAGADRRVGGRGGTHRPRGGRAVGGRWAGGMA
jgi:alkanesulfonate monooxygenase SsuD/methylene tetrahydromethanopterin reductase-like flavin-dependent oxidoreductase (luciferase family)